MFMEWPFIDEVGEIWESETFNGCEIIWPSNGGRYSLVIASQPKEGRRKEAVNNFVIHLKSISTCIAYINGARAACKLRGSLFILVFEGHQIVSAFIGNTPVIHWLSLSWYMDSMFRSYQWGLKNKRISIEVLHHGLFYRKDFHFMS